jgi:GAF domain-containing protein/HAMP domain-containing protein
MNTHNRGKANRILSSLGFKLWGPPAMGTLITLLAIGYLFVSNDRSPLLFLAISLFLAAAVAITIWAINRHVLRPLRELRDDAAMLAHGQLTHRITLRTGDELERLAQEFNSMAENLQRSQQQLAAFAQEKVRQAEEAQMRVREMTSLLEAGHAITSLDLDNVLDRLATEAVRAVNADQCLIYLQDAANGKLRVRGASDTGRLDGKAEYQDVALRSGESAAGWVLVERQPLFLATAQADPRFVPQTPSDKSIASLLVLPLLVAGQSAPVGVLQVATQSGKPFSREDQTLLVPFVQQAGVAYQNAQLYEEERRRARELSLISEITRTINTSLDLEDTLNAILASVQKVVPYDLAEICLWEPNEGVLRTRALGADPKYAAYAATTGGTYTLQEGLTGWIALRAQGGPGRVPYPGAHRRAADHWQRVGRHAGVGKLYSRHVHTGQRRHTSNCGRSSRRGHPECASVPRDSPPSGRNDGPARSGCRSHRQF